MPQLVFSPDYMAATLKLDALEQISAEEVYALLAKRGVCHGVLDDAVRHLAGLTGPEEVVVAQGTPAIEPVDARVEYGFETGPAALRPTILEDGRADFRAMGFVHNVVPGQVLARRWPPRLAKPGTTVLGHLVQPAFPKDVTLMAGKGAEVSPDGQTIVAVEGGAPYVEDGVVSVRKSICVRGDVGLATGHIHFDGDLEVTGNVQTQMRVQATGAIVVHGFVEGAALVAGGKIVVGGSVRKQSLLEAGSDVMTGVIENSTVRARGSVAVKGDVVQSDIEAHESLLVGGQIVGGVSKLGARVFVRQLGSRMGAATVVRIASPPSAGLAIAAMENEQAKIHETLVRLTPRIREAQAALAAGKRSPLTVEQLRKELELATLMNQRYAALAEKKDALLKAHTRNPVRARLDVRDAIFQEVAITLADSHLKVTQPYPGCTMVDEDGTIRTLPYMGQHDTLPTLKPPMAAREASSTEP